MEAIDATIPEWVQVYSGTARSGRSYCLIRFTIPNGSYAFGISAAVADELAATLSRCARELMAED